ncbi:nucleotidyl transferase AbiEii/AbiGii toxin family protein [Streptomyces shenzhenensis]|uniref:nucleotidyl transferase AbiEii/AbiGii toxin family protein n=1 Tax=Streptomyces shenzhenensis TaxID=943815 RepID=UPI001F291412|nr:nucleotidyl transferase AbiEii/AbiGii toxin family protein [Streptomyces shenzhenensis]
MRQITCDDGRPGFSDPVTPGPRLIDYLQQLTEEDFQIFGCPMATVIAEKLSTAVSLGGLNTRHRDYGDLYRLLTLNDLDGQELTTALTATASHRGITLKPLSTTITDLGERRQTSYAAWRRRQGPAATGSTPNASLTSSGRSPSSQTRSSTTMPPLVHGTQQTSHGHEPVLTGRAEHQSSNPRPTHYESLQDRDER